MNNIPRKVFPGLRTLSVALVLLGSALGSSGRGDDGAVAPAAAVPKFSHVVIIFLENREFDEVIGNAQMRHFNGWAERYALLTQYYGVRHPSLPNYIALVGGSTFGITTDCVDCHVDARSLADLVEASGRTWKTYQESLPRAGYTGGNSGLYAKKHNPFVYFDAIRSDAARAKRSVVPLTELATDLAADRLPDFAFIMPNLCNSAHDCDLSVADAWLGRVVGEIMKSKAFDAASLLVISWDEGSTDAGCCGSPPLAVGGRIATILISSLVKGGFKDATPYSHYSLLRTIEEAWGLEKLGLTGEPAVSLISAPWK